MRQDLAKIAKQLNQDRIAASGSRSKFRVPLGKSTVGEEEIAAILRCLVEENFTMGEITAEFEEAFANFLGVRHAAMVNSGSSANHLLLAALRNPLIRQELRLEEGDEVIVPALTWSTTIWPVIDHGCTPVLVDAHLETLNMSMDAVENAITHRTKAIFAAHILGNAVDLTRLQELAGRFGLILLEDSCESLGTTYGGKPVGSFSRASSFSFYFSHHITTIEGGMIATDDPELDNICRCLRAHGWSRDLSNKKQIEASYPSIDPRFLFVNLGYNLRPTDLQAAIGLCQLRKLPHFNRRRCAIAGMFLEAFKGFDALRTIQPTESVSHTWFGFPVLLPSISERQRLTAHLEQQGIETRPIVAGSLDQHPAMKSFPHRVAGQLTNAHEIMGRGLYWSCHPLMTDADAQYVIDTVRQYFGVL